MFAAQHAATVPKIQLTLRKAFGFGSTAMGMNPFDNQTLNLAYPGVSFGAMPARGADDATGADDNTRAALREAEEASGYRSASALVLMTLLNRPRPDPSYFKAWAWLRRGFKAQLNPKPEPETTRTINSLER